MNEDVQELTVVSSMDSSPEKSLFYFPENGENVPLVVALHAWSHDRFNHLPHLKFARERGWAMLMPEFRGCNLVKNPRCTEACGSELARQDIVDAVEYVRKNYRIDPEHVILFGASGGGHMTLLTAAWRPELWYCASAWCPVTDLIRWYDFAGKEGAKYGYVPHIEKCLGGSPDSSAEVREEYCDRSPISHLDDLMKVNILMLQHGKHDDVVPYTFTAELYCELEKRGHPHLYLDLFNGVHAVYAEEAFRKFDRLPGLRRMDGAAPEYKI
ncbi:MAG: Prolyl endopeptidase precursor [Lentisphaerae bacterium ADurb.Bin242]|nr:MAG: Prolyl endopeptidase precursor [Lentisphaerae bacterium ADurb.Bin242]